MKMEILASSAGDVVGIVVSIICGSAALLGFFAFLIKALIHKTNTPLTNRVKNLEDSMLISEESVKSIKTIMDLVQDMPEKIDKKIEKREKEREEVYNLRFATKEELHK